MKVFVIHKNGRPASSNFDYACDGFTDLGYEVIPFEAQQLYSLGNTIDDIVCAGIPFMHIIWRNLGVNVPSTLNIPEELVPFAKRKIWIEPFNDVLKRFLTDAPEPIFIKPLTIEKLFTGIVIKSLKDLLYVKDVAKDIQVLCSEVIDIKTEYRCYINYYNKIVDMRRYTGSYRQFPDVSVADNIIKAYKNPFIAYSVDLGITSTGETVLIELNDSYALGNYGIPSDDYAKMLANRWWEVVDKRENIVYN